jgi:hypothetical protein
MLAQAFEGSDGGAGIPRRTVERGSFECDRTPKGKNRDRDRQKTGFGYSEEFQAIHVWQVRFQLDFY